MAASDLDGTTPGGQGLAQKLLARITDAKSFQSLLSLSLARMMRTPCRRLWVELPRTVN
jgi:hypothetical protein